MKTDPYDRTSLEMRILGHLKDASHTVLLLDLVDRLDPNLKETIVCTVLDFRDEGLVSMRDLGDGGQLIGLTPQGESLINTIYSGRISCG